MIAVALDASLLPVLDRLPDPVLIADDNRRYVFANPAAANLLGIPREQLVKMRIDDLSGSGEVVEEMWREFLRVGYQNGPFCLTCPDGSTKYIDFSAVANFQPGLHISFWRDMTEQRESELQRLQAQHLAELALSAGQMGSWIWSVKTGEGSWNRRLKELFELPVDGSYTYQTFLERIHPEDLETVTTRIGEALSSADRYELEYRIHLRDGSIRWISDRGEVVFDGDGNRVGISGVAWDITQRRSLEQERANHIRELARSNIDLQRFAQVASHEIKEPLRTICALSDLLDRQSGHKLNEDEREILHLIVGASKRMAELIDRILTYAKTGLRRDVVLTETPLSHVVDQAISNLRLTLEQTGAHVNCGPLPTLKCASLDLVQVFQNLIGNAVKYCTAKPLIHISAKYVDHAWTLSVQDNGIGMAKEQIDGIFEMFKRLHDHEYPGSGVGLAICKAIVEKHGGQIWVESEPGKGSTFTFSIPTE